MKRRVPLAADTVVEGDLAGLQLLLGTGGSAPADALPRALMNTPGLGEGEDALLVVLVLSVFWSSLRVMRAAANAVVVAGAAGASVGGCQHRQQEKRTRGEGQRRGSHCVSC